MQIIASKYLFKKIGYNYLQYLEDNSHKKTISVDAMANVIHNKYM